MNLLREALDPGRLQRDGAGWTSGATRHHLIFSLNSPKIRKIFIFIKVHSIKWHVYTRTVPVLKMGSLHCRIRIPNLMATLYCTDTVPIAQTRILTTYFCIGQEPNPSPYSCKVPSPTMCLSHCVHCLISIAGLRFRYRLGTQIPVLCRYYGKEI